MYQAFWGIRICNVCNDDGVYDTVERNVLCGEHKLAYSCVCCIDQTQVAIQLSVLYRLNTSCHTAVCAVQTKHKLPYSCVYCIDQTPDSCLMQLWIFIHHPYVSIHHHNHDTKEHFMCHSVTVSLCALFTPLQHSIHYSNAMKQTASQTLACSEIK